MPTRAAELGPSRLVFDLSTLARWSGPPVGIVRVETELARRARRHHADVVFAFFDPELQVYREIRPKWVPALLEGGVGVEPTIAPRPGGRRRRSDRIPRAIRPAAMWLLQSRRSALLLLERFRLGARSEAIRRLAARLQEPLITDKYRPLLFDFTGRRRSLVAAAELFGPPIELGASDLLVCTGAPWEHSNISQVQRLKQRAGFSFATLCHDIIPLQFPQFYRGRDVSVFRSYVEIAFPLAELVVFTAKTTASDALAYCAANGIPLGQTAVVPLGAAQAVTSNTSTPLPPGLEKDKYALFVSTIEPRKGHAMLLQVWRELTEQGLPQREGFKLVFVGRHGWLVDDLLVRLKDEAEQTGRLLVLTSVPDEQLARLYEDAAFCVYPSIHEGFGLPVIEAFSRGKAVLTSTGGALPEVVDGLSPCLDPHDPTIWRLTLARWMSDPTLRRPYEDAIRARFRLRTWETCAHEFFATVAPRDVAVPSSLHAMSEPLKTNAAGIAP